MTTILVTGAGGGQHGSMGTLVATQLLARGLLPRALAHHLGPQSERLAALGADVVQGDLLDIASVRAALAGVRRAYFAYPVKDGLLEATAVFAAAAKEAGLELVVNVSNLNAEDPLAPSPRTRQHWLSENVFDWANVGAVHLRPAIFFESIRRQTAGAVRAQTRPSSTHHFTPIVG